jgi:hypothetical protein
MTRLPVVGVVEVADFAAAEDFMAARVPVVFKAAACAWLEELGRRTQ